MSVLSAEVRKYIVAVYREGGRTQATIAEMVGTTQSNVSKVLAKWRRRDPSIRRRFAAANPKPAVTSGADRRQFCFAASQLGSPVEPLNLDKV
jgi:transposase-like protein